MGLLTPNVFSLAALVSLFQPAKHTVPAFLAFPAPSIAYPPSEYQWGHRHRDKTPGGLTKDVRRPSTLGGAEEILKRFLVGTPVGFQTAVLSLADHESQLTLSLPADSFNADPKKGRIVTSWGIFQFNRIAWKGLNDPGFAFRRVSIGDAKTTDPWDATVEDEIRRPLFRFLDVWNRHKGGNKQKAFALYCYFISPPQEYALWRGRPVSAAVTANANARVAEAFPTET